jgi:hypothetical protein
MRGISVLDMEDVTPYGTYPARYFECEPESRNTSTSLLSCPFDPQREECLMSTSLLLALLETHGNQEPDYSGEYVQWARGDPNRKRLMLNQLYDVLQSTTVMGMPASNALGTVLARTLSDDPREGLAEAKLVLRATLKYELVKRFNALKEQYPVGSYLGARSTSQVGSYPSDRSSQPLGDVLYQLLELILQRMR